MKPFVVTVLALLVMTTPICAQTIVEEGAPRARSGEELSAFTRAAMAADVTAALANWGSAGLQFINVDYTLSLSRLPDGPVLGLGSRSHYSVDGVAASTATLMDRQGPIGTCVSLGLAHSGFRPEQR